jgi:V/A-type H+-transporting ATPase subunit F
MKKIIFLTPSDAEYGFRLTGAEQYAVDMKDVESLIKKLMAEPDSGLIILDERLREGISEDRLREMEKRWEGIFLILPAPERKGREVEDYALMLIRKAIGYHVRLSV